MKTKKDLKVGDKIYVVKSGWMYRGEPKLEEHTIEKINTSSLYYKSGETSVRISLSDMKGKLATTHFTAYVNKEDYYEPIRKEKEKNEVVKDIQKIIKEGELSLEQLKEIREFASARK